ncbi:uncharacterized protein LOC120344337 [Styela clava]
MRNKFPEKLFSSSIQCATKRIFDCLIDIEEEVSMQQIVRDFIVNACLPRSLLLRVVRLLLIYLDRGYNVFPINGSKGEVEESARTKSRVTNGDVNNLGRRQRSVKIIKALIHCILSSWGDKQLLPQYFFQDDGVSSRTLSLRGRQTVLVHIVESFVCWSDIMGSGELQSDVCANSEKWPCPPKTLNLRSEHGNWSGTRTALAAISSIIKSETTNSRIFEPNQRCFKCKRNTTNTTYKKTPRDSKRPVINMDIVLMGSIQDWVVDVLLFVLRNSSSKGFDIEISSIRSEDVDLYKLCEIIRSLRMPHKVQSLELRMKDPRSIFTASHVFRTLTGLQSFKFAHLWRRATQRTELTTQECIRLRDDILQHWKDLSKMRLEGIVLFSDFTSTNQALTAFLNPNMQYLEFSYDSLSEQTLDWILHWNKNSIRNKDGCHLEQQQNYPRMVCNNIHTMRFDNEALLSANANSFSKFLALLKNSCQFLKTLEINQCGFTESQAKQTLSQFLDFDNKQTDLFEPSDAYTFNLPLEHFTFRERRLSAKVILDMFTSLCAAKRNHLSSFAYFGVLSPKRSDVFWQGQSPTKSLESWVCPFELSMNKISKQHHCSHVYCDVFWEPCEDDTL